MEGDGISLIDSSSFHKDTKSELMYQVSKYTPYLKSFVNKIDFFYLVLWIFLLRLAIFHQIQLLFFILTGFFIIFFNLGTKQKGEISAYSIFNKDQQKILGTFNHEDFDQQMRGGGMMAQKKKSVENEEWEKDWDSDEENFKKQKQQFDSMSISKKSNLPCYCGSQEKYKKCCYWRELKLKDYKQKNKDF